MIIGEPTSCSLNPITGHEIEWKLTPIKKKKSLLVIGGGPGGIEAARAGAERGFDVTLWEASDRLCGSLWPASKPDFKRDISLYINYLTGLAERLPVKIELNKKLEKNELEGAPRSLTSTKKIRVHLQKTTEEGLKLEHKGYQFDLRFEQIKKANLDMD